MQPWLSTPPEKLGQALSRCRAAQPRAKIVFIDGFANTDLRFGRAVEPFIDLYLRKTLFRDRRQFLRPFRGDTNLTDYYSGLYDISAEPVDWQVPEALLDRLGLLPNFLTAPYLTDGFLGEAPRADGRSIDLQVRIATRGTPWYQAMREHSERAARQIDGIRLTPRNRIDRAAFLDELRQCRLCWSPFGYGELCWRDLEAMMTGAVLIKPAMTHLETAPDLYRPGETYLPVKWNFADLDVVVREALANPAGCAQIAATAFAAARDYLQTARFVTDMGELLQLTRR